jgi:p24 family protein delta-1
VAGEARMAFTSHGESTIEVCFENILRDGMQPGPFRSVELDVDIGSDAYDYAALQKAEVRL